MPRSFRILLLVLPVLALAACDRHPIKKPDPTKGTVTGQVLCADTGKPARFATVTLTAEPGGPEAKSPEGAPLPASETTLTDLDGRFRMEAVLPGRYFAYATLDGYLDPMTGLDFERIEKIEGDRKQADEALAEWKDHMAEIEVRAHRVVEIPLKIERAAEIQGAVTFDDGSPAVGMHFRLLRRREDGRSTEVGMALFREWKLTATTDRHGRYALTSLPAGEYTVCALMPADTESESSQVCLGNVFRRTGAKTVKVAAGEEATGVDIEVPLAGLHTVAGTLSTRTDGHPIAGATLRLLWADDKEKARETKSEQDGGFRFAYVPEGKFILQVTGAQDAQDFDINRKPSENRPTVVYADKQMPLTVQQDMEDVNVALELRHEAPVAPGPKP